MSTRTSRKPLLTRDILEGLVACTSVISAGGPRDFRGYDGPEAEAEFAQAIRADQGVRKMRAWHEERARLRKTRVSK